MKIIMLFYLLVYEKSNKFDDDFDKEFIPNLVEKEK